MPAFEVALRRMKLGLGRLFGDADAVLLGLQEIEGDRVRVEGLQKLASLFGEPDDRLREQNSALRGFGLALHDLDLQLFGEPLHPCRGQLDLPVEVLDERLGVAHLDVWLATPRPRGPSLA
ncbi:MAG: hypothetical protein ACRDG8_07470 [Actinomycetota bacterium]